MAVVFLTMHKDEHFLNRALDLEVKGYVVKESALSEIVHCLRAVASGQEYVSPRLTSFLLSRSRRAAQLVAAKPEVATLTAMERRVLRLLGELKSSKQIADELCLSVRTIEHHRERIGQRLKLQGKNALLRFALDHMSEL